MFVLIFNRQILTIIPFIGVNFDVAAMSFALVAFDYAMKIKPIQVSRKKNAKNNKIYNHI